MNSKNIQYQMQILMALMDEDGKDDHVALIVCSPDVMDVVGQLHHFKIVETIYRGTTQIIGPDFYKAGSLRIAGTFGNIWVMVDDRLEEREIKIIDYDWKHVNLVLGTNRSNKNIGRKLNISCDS